MKKVNILKTITDCGIVAIIRTESKEEAVKIFDALVAGGIKSIEISYTTPGANEAIQAIAAQYGNSSEVVVGAGTILDAETARIAILAGAQFIVSPTFDAQTAKLCNLYQVPYLPGCMTVTEMKTALEYGVDIIKLFPGNMFSPEFVRAVKAPLPQVNIMPTGGVRLENIADWFKNGSVAVGIGDSLIAPAKLGDYEKVSQIASQYLLKVQEARH
ncbi:bifunctional 4-hydroxy-2-oxoglutarate aldolase/2-dehydro-3-deoxy-phosphogluconate aldolase [Bacillus marasmi]|uniref:bifunctional 4-hydroxy-2-oxoglutarate aldolase/2-dehydro-3-deoxy-phosphogluconate aldolase n=1 Tax=Bacillus marasmi TaxID=1926279 RepID=UPI0011CB78E3|nr:bifunctional 4-hydroxy-2-oxoglutarate aldolase/2-dehydro-3-deoxy-phosphogluconate aldolase [Bacillus marasmi]